MRVIVAAGMVRTLFQARAKDELCHRNGNEHSRFDVHFPCEMRDSRSISPEMAPPNIGHCLPVQVDFISTIASGL